MLTRLVKSRLLLSPLFLTLILTEVGSGAFLRPTGPANPSCGNQVGDPNRFTLRADYGPNPYSTPVDHYLSATVPINVVTDVSLSWETAVNLWQVNLSEFGGLTIETRMGEELTPRVGIVLRPEVLPYRLTSGLLFASSEEPKWFAVLPEKSNSTDLARLRRTLFYGMGQGVFQTLLKRATGNHRTNFVSVTEHSSEPQFTIDGVRERAESQRRRLVAEACYSHWSHAVDLFALLFAAEVAARAQLESAGDFAELMRLTGLPKTSQVLTQILSQPDASTRQTAVVAWGDRVIAAARKASKTPAETEKWFAKMDQPLLAKIRAAQVARPTVEASQQATQAIADYLEALENQKKEWVAKHLSELDDLIVQSGQN